MVTIAIAIIVIAVIALVGWPYFSPSGDSDDVFSSAADPVLENLVVQRDATYAAIKDLEFDYAMGKLSEADYKSMRAKSETKAVAILQELDGLKPARGKNGHGSVREDLIERQVRRLRRGTAPARTVKCPKCGSLYSPDDAFCAKCGTSLRGVRCPTCGTRAALGDKFCAHCGARIATPV